MLSILVYLIKKYNSMHYDFSQHKLFEKRWFKFTKAVKWLLDDDVLDQNDYNEKIAKLDELFPLITLVKGFTFGPN
jgi:hypothetical protein